MTTGTFCALHHSRKTLNPGSSLMAVGEEIPSVVGEYERCNRIRFLGEKRLTVSEELLGLFE